MLRYYHHQQHVTWAGFDSKTWDSLCDVNNLTHTERRLHRRDMQCQNNIRLGSDPSEEVLQHLMVPRLSRLSTTSARILLELQSCPDTPDTMDGMSDTRGQALPSLYMCNTLDVVSCSRVKFSAIWSQLVIMQVCWCWLYLHLWRSLTAACLNLPDRPAS